MTRIVTSVLAETPDDLYERARQAARDADLIEIRLDGPSGLPWDLRAYFQGIGKPAIATVRHELDGGRSHADDTTRAELLRRAMRAGAAYVDVELHHDEAATLVHDAHAMGCKVILSVHDLTGTPPLDALLDDVRRARKMGADIVKIATTVRAPEDAVALVEAALLARREGIPLSLMGVNDAMLRLLAPAVGLALVYAAPEDAPATAAGQVRAAKTRDVHEDLERLMPRPIGGATRTAFLLGHPVAHSLSPAMQNAAFAAAGIDGAYVALDVVPEKLADAVRGLQATNALGCNVTVPHKVAALQLVDELDESARRAGALNTLVFTPERRVVGHNTDGAGALDALREAGVALENGLPALVLGAGGAARAVVAALVDAGARVTIANRTHASAQELAQQTGAVAVPWEQAEAAAGEARLVVNATSLGLLDAGTTPVPVAALRDDAIVFDCVYRRGGTPLVRQAKARNLKVVTGEAMLLHQGARAFRLWTGVDAPVAAMRTALEDQEDTPT